MRHLVPVARWYGFGFGYCVAEAVGLTMCYQVGGPYLVREVAPMLNAVLLLAAIYALALTTWRLMRSRVRDGATTAPAARSADGDRREAPLGMYAKSDSRQAGLARDLDRDTLDAVCDADLFHLTEAARRG